MGIGACPGSVKLNGAVFYTSTSELDNVIHAVDILKIQHQLVIYIVRCGMVVGLGNAQRRTTIFCHVIGKLGVANVDSGKGHIGGMALLRVCVDSHRITQLRAVTVLAHPDTVAALCHIVDGERIATAIIGCARRNTGNKAFGGVVLYQLHLRACQRGGAVGGHCAADGAVRNRQGKIHCRGGIADSNLFRVGDKLTVRGRLCGGCDCSLGDILKGVLTVSIGGCRHAADDNSRIGNAAAISRDCAADGLSLRLTTIADIGNCCTGSIPYTERKILRSLIKTGSFRGVDGDSIVGVVNSKSDRRGATVWVGPRNLDMMCIRAKATGGIPGSPVRPTGLLTKVFGKPRIITFDSALERMGGVLGPQAERPEGRVGAQLHVKGHPAGISGVTL